ncbi:MAG: phytanoyl-CoA dioxygenase family protein [Planctomycetes bacterium]|nr:phytanoyl-CoA dioxygenase family protein [Planctomycetota bacterium]
MAGLTAEQMMFFEDEGYLILEKLVPDRYVDALIQEIHQTIEDLAQAAYKEGKIRDLCAGEAFETRLIALNGQSEEFYGRMSGGQMNGPAMFTFLTCNEILDVAESFVGPDLLNNGIYRLRPKLPLHPRTEVNWHQDAGYVKDEAKQVTAPAFWIPLVDADEENGCLWVIPRAHKRGILKHIRAKHYLDIDPADFPDTKPIPAPVKRGGALIIHNLAPHCSKPHSKRMVRWSVDTRYQLPTLPTGYPWEAPFLVRSRRWPDRVVRTHEEFLRIRKNNLHESFA